MQTELFQPRSRARITPRDYQLGDHDEFFRLVDGGERGVLTRAFTGGGKTIMACIKADTWLRRGPDYRVGIISFEKQLVWQFADEVYDVLGIRPGIEMEKQCYDDNDPNPSIIVFSRQSLIISEPPDAAMIEAFQEHGVSAEQLGACPKHKAKSLLGVLAAGADEGAVLSHLLAINEMREAKDGKFSRLHKFDWQLNWLLVFDEAHRHAHSLKSVGPIVDWFDRNPKSKRNGLTATPKRADGISIGHKMFPGVAIDYPLFSKSRKSAVKDGYAVPYVQKYISVEGVDFAEIKKIAGDYDQAELEKVLGSESQLATLVEPLLDLVGDRSTLIFNPGVDMARNVSRYINARRKTVCPSCQKVKWYPKLLVGDGAKCDCGTMLCPCDAHGLDTESAQAVWGELPPAQRTDIYEGHQKGNFQFLSVCGLCREGYNDPNIACVAVFRPVSQAASALAEQMKGRGCRPLRGLINGLNTAEERLAAIAGSTKPNTLIVDLVGITGLADCASTVQIYADGIEDEVVKRAAELLSDSDDINGVEDAIDQAQQEIADERERVKQERLAAEKRAREEYERRAKAHAKVTYTEHEVGVAGKTTRGSASDAQFNFVESLGMGLQHTVLNKAQAGRIIDQLIHRVPLEEVAAASGMETSQWYPVGPSIKQFQWLKKNKISAEGLKCRRDACIVREAFDKPEAYKKKLIEKINGCRSVDDLPAIREDLRVAKRVLPQRIFNEICNAGVEKKQSLPQF